MPQLISGSLLRRGTSGEFIDLAGAQPQLPATETTATGFTVATDNSLRTSYRSSLGFVHIYTASLYSLLPEGTIRILATGTSFLSTSTASGTLVVTGGIGVGGNMNIAKDITVNNLTIGRGFEGINNIVFRGTATTSSGFETGQNSIAIGYDTLQGLTLVNKVIAIGRNALSSGTRISNTIAIGDSALTLMGTNNYPILATLTNVTRISSSTVSAATNASPIIVTAINHSLSTGSQIFITGVQGLATATTATSVLNNTKYWVDVLTTNTLALYLNKSLTVPSNGITATVGTTVYALNSYTSGGVLTSPALVTSPSHNLGTGTAIYIDGIVGTSELNQSVYYVDRIDSSTLALFGNSTLLIPTNASTYGAYVSSGTIYRYVINDDNIAIGVNAAPNLINGSDNFFFGNNVAINLTTGSNNTIIGHNQFNNLTSASGIIAIGADNLVDLKDNQINIGSLLYYDGAGNTDINGDVRLGLGTDSTGTNSGALVVLGGMSLAGKVYSYAGGAPDEDYELYTPVITINTGTAPSNPRIGDIWINSQTNAYLQYIKDGTSTFWLQTLQL
jgi:hypothetical protein